MQEHSGKGFKFSQRQRPTRYARTLERIRRNKRQQPVPPLLDTLTAVLEWIIVASAVVFIVAALLGLPE